MQYYSYYWRRQWQPTPVLLPGKSHGWRSLIGCSLWGHEDSDMTERLHFHFSLSCIGEGNGNPLQCSCLENPRDGGAWWAAVYGVTQSRTRRKQLSSSSNSIHIIMYNAYICIFTIYNISISVQLVLHPVVATVPVIYIHKGCNMKIDHEIPRLTSGSQAYLVLENIPERNLQLLRSTKDFCQATRPT